MSKDGSIIAAIFPTLRINFARGYPAISRQIGIINGDRGDQPGHADHKTQAKCCPQDDTQSQHNLAAPRVLGPQHPIARAAQMRAQGRHGQCRWRPAEPGGIGQRQAGRAGGIRTCIETHVVANSC